MHAFTVSRCVGTCIFFLQERFRSLLLKDVKLFTCTYAVLPTTINVSTACLPHRHICSLLLQHVLLPHFWCSKPHTLNLSWIRHKNTSWNTTLSIHIEGKVRIEGQIYRSNEGNPRVIKKNYVTRGQGNSCHFGRKILVIHHFFISRTGQRQGSLP